MVMYERNGKLFITFNGTMNDPADIILSKTDKINVSIGDKTISGNIPKVISSAEDFTTALTDSDTTSIVLENNISIADQIKIEKDLRIDLGGHIISLNNSTVDTPLRINSGNVVLSNGTIDATFANETVVPVCCFGGTLELNNLTVYAKTSKESCVFCGWGGIVNIISGVYENLAKDKYFWAGGSSLVLNISNDNVGTINCFGGIFIGKDPALGDDRLGGTFVAEGYKSEKITYQGKKAFMVIKK